jgi:hypothetical protein
MNDSQLKLFQNPYRPGAGHKPPHLAGRSREKNEFTKLLSQHVILDNLVLTGLRGVGKTVLLDEFKPIAIQQGWLWAGTDMSEAVSVSEQVIAMRIITDISVITSDIEIGQDEILKVGFIRDSIFVSRKLNYETLTAIYNNVPGLVSDKLKKILEITWSVIRVRNKRGIIFAYDEAQTLSDQAKREQYPLSLLLDVFQSIQKMEIPFMLVLVGLPPLFPKLVEARTFAERMFHVVLLDRLNDEESKEAIIKPLEGHPVKLVAKSIEVIIKLSGGYPYFIQFICREVYDRLLSKLDSGNELNVPTDEIVHKLDADFFAGRWERATDRQRELLRIAAALQSCDNEFTVQEIVDKSKESDKPFSNSHANQMLVSLCKSGLIYKNRHGKYSFAVPLLWQFIRRQGLEHIV